MSFSDYLGADGSRAVIQRRIFEMAEEGYQHQLNIEYTEHLLEGLSSEGHEAERDELFMQREAARIRAGVLEQAIKWHETRLTAFDKNTSE
jgi:hypothetical protein